MHPIDHIRNFTTMTPELERRLLSVICEKKFKKGEIIRGATNLSSFAYYIVQGSTRLFFTYHGKEHTFSFSFENEFISISRKAVMDYGDTLSIQFLEPTTLIFIPHLKTKDILEGSSKIQDSEALIFINVALSEYCLFLEERVHIMQTASAVERYKWAIERYPRLLQTATLTQIASFLGITKETLYRIRSGTY